MCGLPQDMTMPVFDFERHRRTQHYGILVERTGVVELALEALNSASILR